MPEREDMENIKESESIADSSGKRPCVFFDRDGVVNRSPGPGYVLSEDAFHLNEGISEALGVVAEKGFFAIVVTSQKGVGKGLMTMEDLERIHDRMQRELQASGPGFDAIYSYTGVPGCDFQPKPDPAMLHAACRDFPIDLARSWMIGDADRDIAMAHNGGLRGTIRIRGEKPISIDADHTLESILALPEILRELL